MNSDISAYRATATGQVFDQSTRVKGVVLTGTATAGTVVIRDGGGSGVIRLQLDILANAEKDIMLPENGIWFRNDVHVTLTNVASVVVLCG